MRRRYGLPVTCLLLLPALAGCVRRPGGDSYPTPISCRYVVRNLTPSAVEIRVRVHPLSTLPIGALNPGEQLNDERPCMERLVWVEGVEVPMQAGAGTRFGVVVAMAELIESRRVRIDLNWP